MSSSSSQDEDFMNQYLQFQDKVLRSPSTPILTTQQLISSSSKQVAVQHVKEMPDDLKKDKSKCIKVKSKNKNPYGLSQPELYQLCVHLNIKDVTKKSTKKVLCDKIFEHEASKNDESSVKPAVSVKPSVSVKPAVSVKPSSDIVRIKSPKVIKEISELPDDLKQDKSKCINVKSRNKNPNGLSQQELYELCVYLNIKSITKKSTKQFLCEKLHEHYAGDALNLNLNLSPSVPSPSSPSSPVAPSVHEPVEKKAQLKSLIGKQGIPNKYNETYTLTFGDQAENHARMQKIGQAAAEGFTHEDLTRAESYFNDHGCETEMIFLNDYLSPEDSSKAEPAYVLIIRNAIEALTGSTADEFYLEQQKLSKDTKAFMYGHVVNKHARHNLCFGLENQEPCYEQAKGRIIAFDDVALLNKMRLQLPASIGVKALNLVAEGNYYYKPEICGIGWHGDSERKMVIALRLGKSMSMHYQWYTKSRPVGSRCDLILNHGDIYYMSEKAVGWDWKKPSLYTLRHAAGAKKFIEIKSKKTAGKTVKAEVKTVKAEVQIKKTGKADEVKTVKAEVKIGKLKVQIKKTVKPNPITIFELLVRENIVKEGSSKQENLANVKKFVDKIIINSPLVSMTYNDTHRDRNVTLVFTYIYDTKFGLIEIYSSGQYKASNKQGREELISSMENTPLNIDYDQLVYFSLEEI